MSFFLTLPSNASSTQYPNNSQSNYTTQLVEPIILDGKYEVALTDFCCSSNIYVNFGQITMEMPFSQEMQTFDLLVKNKHETTQQLVDEINEALKRQLCKPDYQNCPSFDEFTNKGAIPKFEYNNATLEFTIKFNSEKGVTLKGTIAHLFFNTSEISITKGTVIKFQPEINKLAQNAAIYLDIIEDQRVGDVKAPILQIINLNTHEQRDTIHVFENPHYIPVNKRFISTINTSILDLQGNPIKFTDIFSTTILKLHFRKVKYE